MTEGTRDREEGVAELLAHYTKFINSRPMLISMFYDADMLPEQIVSMRGAVSVAVVCDVWRLGELGELPAAPIGD